MSQKQIDKSGNGNKLHPAAVTALICALLVTGATTAVHISDIASGELAIEATLGGKHIGYVASYSDLTNACTRLTQTVKKASQGTYNPTFDIDYNYIYVNDPVYLTDDECYDILWSQVSRDFCTAYVLYVDDARAAAHESKNALDELVGSIESQLAASIPEDYSDVIISSRIRIEEELCMKTSLRSIEEINTLLNPLVAENSTPSGDADMLYARVASVEAAAPKIDSSTDANDSLTIEYNLLSTVTLTETIPYETVYIDDYESFTGTEKVIEEGSDGTKAVTYELVYDASGVYLEKHATSETVITEPISRVISRGVVEIPKAEPTGTLIWPCDRPKGVSSYYGWRDLYGRPDFHLGIDIPDVKGSNIWAADGGKVLYAGFTPSYGYNVHVEHSNGFSTLYAHLDTICVNVGDMLYPGQKLGTMGNTGVAYGTHLHFEVRINNKTVDPMGYLPEE